MATLTREQAHKRQAAAPDGWNYDWKHYLCWGENQLKRQIRQPDGALVIGTVRWRENSEKHFSPTGYTYTTPSGNYSPFLNVSRWTETAPGSDVWTSYGLGKDMQLSGEKFTRRNYKELCNFAGSVSDQQILDLFFGNLQSAV